MDPTEQTPTAGRGPAAADPGPARSDSPPAGSDTPLAECDIVMKGGITSGVVYPLALRRFARTYRLRGLGGSSAGAIGAALGAAAEYNRAGGGFDELEQLPPMLGGGRLRDLFIPSPGTRATLRLMLAAVDTDRRGAGKALGVLIALLTGHPLMTLLGLLPGVALIVIAALDGLGSASAVALLVLGVLVAAVGALLAAGAAAWRELSVRVAGNLFGICRGLGDGERQGFTDWLAERIDTTAGMSAGRTLTFGDLWSGPDGTGGADDKYLDLEMLTTCLSQSRPYQLPTESGGFYYDPEEWRTLFPAYVMDALDAAPVPWQGLPDDALTKAQLQSRWEAGLAERAKVGGRTRRLRRLPPAEHLPVVVATRMSLSFPLLISMIPLYAVDRRRPEFLATLTDHRTGEPDDPQPHHELAFDRLWFSDGGLCSNFPVHLFDAALPTRPTFAINLGRFPEGARVSTDPADNVEYAVHNRPLLPEVSRLPERGLGALIGFAAAAVNTARNWQDNSHLNFPGFRDRIVRVLQTRAEGGLNLQMDSAAIDALSERGQAAAEVMVRQFTEQTYGDATGWDNHRWVRYRSLLAALPPALHSFDDGLAVLDVDRDDPPSFRFGSRAEREIADALTDALAEAAATVAGTSGDRVAATAPRPLGIIRRIPPQ